MSCALVGAEFDLLEALLAVLSLPAMMTLLHGSKTGRSMCYAVPAGHGE